MSFTLKEIMEQCQMTEDAVFWIRILPNRQVFYCSIFFSINVIY